MATAFQKRVKQVIEVSSNVFADKIICHGNETVSVKRGYFYKHGMTSKKWAIQVETELLMAGLNFNLIEYRNDHKEYPQDSYFVAVVEERK